MRLRHRLDFFCLGSMSRRLGILACLIGMSFAIPSARAETGEVRLGTQFGFIYLPLNVAEAEGLVARHAEALGVGPLKVTLRRFSGTPAMNESLLSGQLDFGALGPPGSIILWEKTKGRQNFKALVGMPLTAFLLYTNKPEVKSLKDFAETDRVAVTAPNSGQAVVFRIAMEKLYGKGQYVRADRMMTSLPHPEAVASLLAGGTIAGYWGTSPYWQTLSKDSRVHVVTTAKEIMGFDINGSELMGSQTFVDANPKVSQALFLGLQDANKLINDNPRRAAEIFIKAENSNSSVDEIAAMLRDGSNTFSVVPSGTGSVAESMAETGMLATPLKSWKDLFFPFVHDLGGS